MSRFGFGFGFTPLGTLLNQNIIASATILIPEGGGIFSGTFYSEMFSEFNPNPWENYPTVQEFTDYLATLNSFTVDWGDGNSESLNYAEYANVPITHSYIEAGEYVIKWYSEYVAFQSPLLTEILKLEKIKAISLTDSEILIVPNFSGSPDIEYINLFGNKYTDSPDFTLFASCRQRCAQMFLLYKVYT